jgi:flagellin
MNLNASASALYLLNNSYTQLNSIANQLASGKSISSAADNPVAWSQAQSADSSANQWTAYAAAADNTSAPELKTASTALTSIAALLGALQTSAMDAQSNPSNSATDLSSMKQSAKAIQAIVNSAASNGVNLLNGTQSATLTFGLGIGSDSVSLTTQSLADSNTQGILQTAQDANASGATNLMALTATDVSAAHIADTLLNIQSAIKGVNGYASTIGSSQNAIASISSFAKSMATQYSDISNSITAADTTALSAKETALQTQIQLATSAMSIANSMGQYAVKLLG